MAYGRVYGLYDPRTGALRYIGQTTYALTQKRRSSCWLRALKRMGLRPFMSQLALGQTKVAVAEMLGVSPTFVHRRLAQSRRG